MLKGIYEEGAMYNKNFFEDMMKMQKNIFDNQKEAYDKFMKSFNFGSFNPFYSNMNMNNFNNPLNFLKDFGQFNQNFENNFKEFFFKVPGYEDTIETYKKNLEFLNKLYLAYGDFYKDLDLVAAQNKLIQLFEIYSDELVEMSKKYFYKLIPDTYYRVLENFNLEKFIRPAIENSKKSIDFYEDAIKNRPEILVEDVKNFYQGILDKIYQMPTIGISEEEKAKSKKDLESYLDLQIKLLDLSLFLEKKNQETALKAQRAYLGGLETEASLEDFADFYKFYINNFEKAYKELINSKDYKEKVEEVLDIVEENKVNFEERFAEKLTDLPIATAKDIEKFMSDIEEMSKNFYDVKKTESNLDKKVTKVKNDSAKEIKTLKEEVEKLKEENQKAKVDADEALKKEVEELKKELAALKKEINKK